ncbi:hypothetical protein [Konateibacter massiliensis]|uniref:hypothetical protein n=1 Tax=Konateibacter massiliensis TaxID=2002841 RepID=UPI000C146818|nr:hypothetical protein [Konateibacter massiliensis]
MKKYDFSELGINKFYDTVCDESADKIHSVMEEVNNSPLQITEEQNARFKEIYDGIAIIITIGNQTISIPNNADNIDTIIAAIKECFNQTL